MSYRLLGALLIIGGCGGFGFSMISQQLHLEGMLKGLEGAMKTMQWELSYRLTPLPELCLMAGKQSGGEVGKVLTALSAELSSQVLPDAASCMQKVLLARKELPKPIKRLLSQLGESLGAFDLPGQLEGLKAGEEGCREVLQQLVEGKSQRLRSYGTLGICGGLALVILFI